MQNENGRRCVQNSSYIYSSSRELREIFEIVMFSPIAVQLASHSWQAIMWYRKWTCEDTWNAWERKLWTDCKMMKSTNSLNEKCILIKESKSFAGNFSWAHGLCKKREKLSEGIYLLILRDFDYRSYEECEHSCLPDEISAHDSYLYSIIHNFIKHSY